MKAILRAYIGRVEDDPEKNWARVVVEKKIPFRPVDFSYLCNWCQVPA